MAVIPEAEKEEREFEVRLSHTVILCWEKKQKQNKTVAELTDGTKIFKGVYNGI